MNGVKIKGSGKKGVIFSIDLSVPLEKIKDTLKSLLIETEEYFRCTGVSLSFQKTNDEEVDSFKIKEIQKIVVNSDFIINSEVEVKEVVTVKDKNKTAILRKSLRSGNKFTYDGTIILIGDLHAGAKIEVTGSFICVGEVNGIVHAGKHKDGEAVCEDEVCIYASKIESPRVKVKNEIIQNIKGVSWLHVV